MTDDKRKELLLKAKPILFNTEMVRAILDGRKTITRRVVKPQPVVLNSLVIPPYKVGDILYVRETYGISNMDYDDKTVGIVYKASENVKDNSYREIKFPYDKFEILYNSMAENSPEWHPSIHMPKEAARIFLRVTGVRVERLQDISDDGVLAEGLEIGAYFDELWDSTIKKSDLSKYGWAANPWVWVIEFERIDENETLAITC